jgi:hypothetical protein
MNTAGNCMEVRKLKKMWEKKFIRMPGDPKQGNRISHISLVYG